MAKNKIVRCCEACGYTIEEDKISPEAQRSTIQCPGCERLSLKIRDHEWMRYAYWKGTIGPGRMLREVVRVTRNNQEADRA